MGERIRTIIDVVFQSTIRGYVLSTCVHEYAHLVVIRLLGGSAVIKSGDLNHANWVFTIPNRGQLPLVYLSGGLATGVIYLLLSIGDSDPETKPIMVAVGVSQIIYGVLECLWYLTGNVNLLNLGGAVLGAGLTVGMGVAFFRDFYKSKN